uniref:SH2 domain-containing protein n=1 Tax=Rhabditophanes sp. KR3021 TaxID=114890 RepID=A0AC35U535_9BILA
MTDFKSLLISISKECQHLYDENKDLQGRFVNDLAELQRYQHAINALANEGRRDQLEHAKQAMAEFQRKASFLYQQLSEKRSLLVNKLNTGLSCIAKHQNVLISQRLFEWKNMQKLQQIGIPFENKDAVLDDIQNDFEQIAEHSWQLRTFTSWLTDLMGREPQLKDNMAQQHVATLAVIFDNLTKLLCMLVSQSFVVAYQPEPVLKTQHKFTAEVRLLIGDKLGVKQQLMNTSVNVTIIAEEEAKLLAMGEIPEKDVKSVGTISNDSEKLTLDDKGHMSAKFNNSKLTRIAHRKPPPKAFQQDVKTVVQTATDQKYALIFHITMFQLINLGTFDLWTLSLPLMVTVHGSQDCDAQGVILWQRAFGSVNRDACSDDVQAVTWPDIAHILKHKFSLFTGASRPLCESDLNYLGEKLVGNIHVEHKPITFVRFAKHNIRDDVTFSFWEWFFCTMQLIKQKLLKHWDEGWLIGFISKGDASQKMMNSAQTSFLFRFSDTVTGALSIGFVCPEEDDVMVPFHLSPFSIKDLDQLSLTQRIQSCPQLQDIKYLYPNIDKEEMLRCFESDESNKADSPTEYIQSEIVMVAKISTMQKHSASSILSSGTPSPMGMSRCLDWSPGDVLYQSNQMDCSDDVSAMLSNATLDGPNIASLLGTGYNTQVPTQPLPSVDLSFMDSQFGSNHANQFSMMDNKPTPNNGHIPHMGGHHHYSNQ